ncbi:MAG: TetR/AcrR family transcriptional regulator [Treponema sp.]|nr:TetR/AcrR family transcriptional regulator [Treponema sp.]
MTKDDIIKAAFKVWGRELYRTTSLSEIARELGVSKPALYRHFECKNALSEAMFSAFFDDICSFIKEGYERAISSKDRQESGLIMMRTMGEYYIRNREAFTFSLFQVYNNRNRQQLNDEFCARGVDFQALAHKDGSGASYPSKMQLGMSTLIFCIAHFHRHGSIDQLKHALLEIEDRITKGLGLNAKKVAALDYQALEELAAGNIYEDTENDTLLKAVAEAVAEAGPWDASMEMVAQRSGLSKSGLYAHFKSKQDMLEQLFISELVSLVNSAKQQIENSKDSEEQLYLAIISIVHHLRSRPEILVAIDWIKTRRLDLGKEVHSRLYGIIKQIKLEAIQSYDQDRLVWIAQWILFMIINVLALWHQNQEKNPSCDERNMLWAKNAAKVPDESFRALFRFIALGLEGMNS